MKIQLKTKLAPFFGWGQNRGTLDVKFLGSQIPQVVMIKGLELDILGDSNFFPSELVQYHRDFTENWDCLKKNCWLVKGGETNTNIAIYRVWLN